MPAPAMRVHYFPALHARRAGPRILPTASGPPGGGNGVATPPAVGIRTRSMGMTAVRGTIRRVRVSARPEDDSLGVIGSSIGDARDLDAGPTAGTDLSVGQKDASGTGGDAETAANGVDCVGTGMDVACETQWPKEEDDAAGEEGGGDLGPLAQLGALLVLVSPFFFWGTAMVAMKGTLDHTTTQFVAALRLVPAGALIVAFALSQDRPLPKGRDVWIALAIFGLVDGTGFQGFLAEGLKRTSAGLGSVIIDSQPLTVALLASIFLGESIGGAGYLGMALGVLGLCMLEVPPDTVASLVSGQGLPQLDLGGVNLADSGAFWMLLAAQSMAVGTVMVRWVCKDNRVDPVQATGWHMIIGGLPLAFYSAAYETGQVSSLTASDDLSLLYTSVFGSAVAYSVFFFNASKGNLTKLSSLTFLTPMFAAMFGYVLLGETLEPFQLLGAAVTLSAVALINTRPGDSDEKTA